MVSDIYNQLHIFTESLPVINTHSHHQEDTYFVNMDLSKLLGYGEIESGGKIFDNINESRALHLEKIRYKTHFIWLQKALQNLYHFKEPITDKNWDEISGIISKAHSQPDKHLDILKQQCKYKKIILDTFWNRNPGSDNNHPDLFTPTFRIDSFFYGFDKNYKNHIGDNAAEFYDISTNDIDEYIAYMKNIIKNKKSSGCIALKAALAYDRGLDFAEASKDKAAKVFKAKDSITPEDIKVFGDYLFFEICRIAAELDLPLQCHTGLARLNKSNALQMSEVIEKNPKTRFVLFHGGYPWLEDIYALAFTYENVYPDICWMPNCFTSAAERIVEELIEVSAIDKICWGCDTLTSEDSFGALLAVRHVLSNVLAKKVHEGYFSVDAAKSIIESILYKNARCIYNMK